MDRHHNAPPLAERLEIEHANLAAKAVECAEMVPDTLAPVATDEDAGAYAETAKTLKACLTAIETARKKEKDQILKDGRAIDGHFAMMSEPVKAAADRGVAAINAFQTKKLEEQRRIQREAEERARREAAAFDEPPPPVAPPVVAKEAARVVGFSGTKAAASVKWVHEITDAAQVPREFLMVNEAAIKAAIAGGRRDIPGVRVFEQVRTAIR
jgi:hypothetical protein